MRTLLLAFLSVTTAAFAEPVSLFDGKSLDGWDFDPQMWRVENGLMTGGSTTDKIKGNHFICTKKNYHNFDLKLKIKCSGDPATGMINSGIQIRSLRVPGGAHMSGYQVDCGAGWFGKIYDEFRRNRPIADPVDAEALAKVVDIFGWNEYRIRAEGPRIQVWINGVLATDYTEQDKNIALDGQLGPQVHSGGVCLVQVKDITIEELPPTVGAPTWESLGGVETARKLVAPPPKAKSKAQADATKQTKGGRDISYNSVEGTARTAADQQKLFKLPPGFEIELVAQESDGIGKFVSVYFDQRGRMWTQTAFEYPVDANENPAAAEAVYQGKGKDKVLVYPREALNAPIPPGGLRKPTVFCDGLAIPLGILPWGNGDTCYVQHGHDLKLFKDTDGDGKADTHDVILTGFGVQDSHLFPHQFTRAPGGWIWMAQGLFNNSNVKRPGDDDPGVNWPKCSMARMRADGSQFEVTSTGPNNIWGLVITGEGEAFIQEANDYGYPVMPFHEYAYYPGGMEALRKSYQPEFPPAAEFRMGGTGLSGLALGEGEFRKLTPTLKEDGLCMFVANPITSMVQTIAMHRDGPYWNLEQAAALITCEDPFFRPVAMTNGPDGCIYIVDWYNKIISHNEVPRAHPDRDKTRGRIWRVKSSHLAPRDEVLQISDFTKLTTEDLLALLGTQPTARAHLAWQTLADRKESGLKKYLDASRGAKSVPEGINHGAQVIQLGWLLASSSDAAAGVINSVTFAHKNLDLQGLDNLEASLDHSADLDAHNLTLLGQKTESLTPEVRFKAAVILGRRIKDSPATILPVLLQLARPSLPGPTTQSSRGPKQIPTREAYDREFERFLVRMFLERHPDIVANFLDSETPSKLPIEARVLASLALEPKSSASRVAKLLPQLDRAPNDEELLRLAQFPDEPGVADALKSLLAAPTSRKLVAEKLLALKIKLDPAKIAPLLHEPVKEMLQTTDRSFATKLVGGFQLKELEEDLISVATLGVRAPTDEIAILDALRDLRSTRIDLFEERAIAGDPSVKDAALAALAASKNPAAPARLLALCPKLDAARRKTALSALSASRPGAKLVVAALLDKSLPQFELDGLTAERLSALLGDDPDLAKLQQQMGGVFRDVLLLDGRNAAFLESQITLDGPFTVECWVRLAEGIGNEDGLLGFPGQVDMNFFQSKFRVWIGGGLHDVVVSQKPITPELWTHVAVTRDAQGNFKLYQNGEFDAAGTKQSTAKFENCRVGWSGPKDGTHGAFCEFRVWPVERTAEQIRANFDRVMEVKASDAGGLPLLPLSPSELKPSAQKQPAARIVKTIDSPPLLTEEQARALDTKFARYTALARKPANLENGKVLSALCMSCHQIGNAGAQIGPNLSGAGAMGLEAVLRNILTPNAAMEPGYRIFRVEMKNGDLIDAFFVSEDKDACIVRQPGLPDRRIPRSEISGTRYIRRSLMPEGMLDGLSDAQATDLLGYLMTLKGAAP